MIMNGLKFVLVADCLYHRIKKRVSNDLSLKINKELTEFLSSSFLRLLYVKLKTEFLGFLAGVLNASL